MPETKTASEAGRTITYADDTEHPLHDFYGRDEDSYNVDLEEGDEGPDGSGRPGIGVMAEAIFIMADSAPRMTVGSAAKALRMPDDAVAQAARWYKWLRIGGTDTDTLADRDIWPLHCVGQIIQRDASVTMVMAIVHDSVSMITTADCTTAAAAAEDAA